jgi:N-acetylmuramic acid 6-phosphate etherase
MVRTGKTYCAWMVDVDTTNEKLRLRARRILREAAGVTDEQAAAALDAAGGHTRTAFVALLADVDAALARAREAR